MIPGNERFSDIVGATAGPLITSFVLLAYLTTEQYAAPGKIVAQGGSAGGMLMGAVVNMAPDAFGGMSDQSV